MGSIPTNALLAAAADIAITTNNPAALISAEPGLVARFEEATGLPREVALWGINILAAIVILVVGFIVSGIARSLLKKVFARRHIDPTIGGFVGNIVHAGIMTFVVITALGQLGVDTKTFAAVIAAAGLAIGLVLQGGLSNFEAGFLIVTFRPFRADDVINGAGIEGTVEEVQVFSTTLNTADNRKIIVPNSALMAGTITNYTANPQRRVDLQFGVGAGQSLAKAQAALIAMAAADVRVLKYSAPTAANAKLIDGGTLVQLNAWCKTEEYATVLSSLIANGPAALAAAGIAGPDKTLYYVERKYRFEDWHAKMRP